MFAFGAGTGLEIQVSALRRTLWLPSVSSYELRSVTSKYPNVHYRIHNPLPVAPILSQINPFHVSPSHLIKILLILSCHLCLDVSSCFLHSSLPTKILYLLLLSPIRATCPAHKILPNFIVRIIFGEK